MTTSGSRHTSVLVVDREEAQVLTHTSLSFSHFGNSANSEEEDFVCIVLVGASNLEEIHIYKNELINVHQSLFGRVIVSRNLNRMLENSRFRWELLVLK